MIIYKCKKNLLKRKSLHFNEGFFLIEVLLSLTLLISFTLLVAQYQRRTLCLHTDAQKRLQALQIALEDQQDKKDFIVTTKQLPVKSFIHSDQRFTTYFTKNFAVKKITVRWLSTDKQSQSLTMVQTV